MQKFDSQLDFAVWLYEQYCIVNNEHAVGARRLFYFSNTIIDGEKLIPTNSPEKCTFRDGELMYRPFALTSYNYQRLCNLLVDARLAGRVSWDGILDDKNDDPSPCLLRREGSGGIAFSEFSPDGFPSLLEVYEEGFGELLEEVHASALVTAPRFTNATHHLLVVFEKDTGSQRVKALCDQYGADQQVFKGQPSVTRVYECCEAAKSRGLPLAVFYFSDLDPAGWDMPTAFMKRVHQIYPHPEHALIRVGLSREQVSTYSLPEAVNVKKISKKQMERFSSETGGDTLVELDALPIPVILALLEEELTRFAGLEDDQVEGHALREIWEKRVEEINAATRALDFSALEEGWERYQRRVARFNALLGALRDLAAELEDERDAITSNINSALASLVDNLLEQYAGEDTASP